MNKFFRKSWQSIAISGIIATILGTITLFLRIKLNTTTTDVIYTLIRLTGYAFIIIGTTFILIDIFNISKKKYWGLYMFTGVVLAILALLFIFNPDRVADFLSYIIGVWAILSGFFMILYIINYRKHLPSPAISIITSVLLIAIGILFIFMPDLIFNEQSDSVIALPYISGGLLVVVGLWQTFNAFRFNRIANKLSKIELENKKSEQENNLASDSDIV